MVAIGALQGAGRAILRTWMLLGLAAAVACTASAGTIDPKRTVSCDVSFSGDVDPGDADKLLAALKAVDTKSAPGPRLRSEQEIERGIYLPRLCLNSKGGSFDEAVTFVRAVITKQSLVTVVEKGAECYSACALLFLTGHHYQGDEYVELYRRMHVESVVGFHAPFIPAIGAAPNDKLLQRSYQAGVEAVAELLNLDQRFFPRRLLAEFLKVGPDKFFKIDEVRHLATWDIGLTGYRRARFAVTGQVERACHHQQLRQDNVYYPVIWAPQWRWESDEDPLSKPEGRQRLPLGPAITRHVVEGMGSEGAFKCVALMQMLGNVLFLSLEYGPRDKHPRDPGTSRPHFLSKKAGEHLAELDPDSYTPAYFLYSGRTKITALSREAPLATLHAEDARKRVEAEAKRKAEEAERERLAKFKAEGDRRGVGSPLQACSQEHRLRSLAGGTSTAITFVNNSPNTIYTYWIDHEGKRKFYAAVPPGNSYVQPTYVTHPWVVTNSQRVCLGVYMPGPAPSRVVIAR